jgi:ABC-type glycerol-3-phosphate transport system permease component
MTDIKKIYDDASEQSHGKKRLAPHNGKRQRAQTANKNRIRLASSDLVFQVFTCSYLSIAAVIVLYPLLYVVAASFSQTQAVISGKVFIWPVGFNVEAYKAVFRHSLIMSGFYNAFIYTIFGTLINVSMTVVAGYVLSRKALYGRNLFMFLFTFTMLFNGGLIPTYLVVRSVGLIDKRLAMMIPNALAVWFLILSRTYFQNSIPDDLAEAAEIDGSSDMGFFLRIVLPLSGAIIAVLTLFYAVGHWNAYFDALIYLRSQTLWPLQIILRNILIQNEITAEMLSNIKLLERSQGIKDLIKFSIIVVSSVPMLLAYPFVQKYFVRGVMVGALKG